MFKTSGEHVRRAIEMTVCVTHEHSHQSPGSNSVQPSQMSFEVCSFLQLKEESSTLQDSAESVYIPHKMTMEKEKIIL